MQGKTWCSNETLHCAIFSTPPIWGGFSNTGQGSPSHKTRQVMTWDVETGLSSKLCLSQPFLLAGSKMMPANLHQTFLLSLPGLALPSALQLRLQTLWYPEASQSQPGWTAGSEFSQSRGHTEEKQALCSTPHFEGALIFYHQFFLFSFCISWSCPVWKQSSEKGKESKLMLFNLQCVIGFIMWNAKPRFYHMD